jgi:hypothetical protein
VLDVDEVETICDPIERASVANTLLWQDHPQPARLRAVRGGAIREAIDAGLPRDQIAERLRVLAGDLMWMSREEWASASPRRTNGRPERNRSPLSAGPETLHGYS